MTNDRYGEAIGKWRVDIKGVDVELEPTLEEVRHIQVLLMDKDNRGNRVNLLDKIENFMMKLLRRSYPDEDEKRQRQFVVENRLDLLEQITLAFRLAKQEDVDKARVMAFNQAKN